MINKENAYKNNVINTKQEPIVTNVQKKRISMILPKNAGSTVKKMACSISINRPVVHVIK